ncbi:cysteine hydrolase family protein [Spirosoma arcticum]
MKQAYGLDIPQNLAEVCDPQRTALIVYDMQIGVLNQIKNSDHLTAQVLRVLTAARRAGLRVIFMRHRSMPKELMGVFQLRMAMAWQRVDTVEDVKPWFLPTSPGFQLTPALEPLPSEAVLDKIAMSAFEGTPLNTVLRDCGLNSFIIVGVATEIGIDPTLRQAADLGYMAILVTDACGAGHQEAAQRSIDNIAYSGDALLTDTDTICEVLKAK